MAQDHGGRSIGSVIFFFQAEDGIRAFDCDWSSDVCSSDLRPDRRYLDARQPRIQPRAGAVSGRAARSEERRVGKSVDLGGRRSNKKKTANSWWIRLSNWLWEIVSLKSKPPSQTHERK